MNALEIRPAVGGDVDDLLGLLDLLGYPAPPEVAAERLERMQAADEPVLVAVSAGRVIGMVTVNVRPVLHRPGPIGRITALAVAQDRQGAGVGRALVAAAEELARAKGCVLMEVTSNVRREAAHAFYERAGYERTSWRFAKPLP